MKKYKLSLFLFRRDLRIEDNTALIKALLNSQKVIPCFILNKEQIENNEYRSDNLLQFMFSSLIELDFLLKNKGGRLYLFYGDSHVKVLEKLFHILSIEAIYFNEDYTPYSEIETHESEICA